MKALIIAVVWIACAISEGLIVLWGWEWFVTPLGFPPIPNWFAAKGLLIVSAFFGMGLGSRFWIRDLLKREGILESSMAMELTDAARYLFACWILAAFMWAYRWFSTWEAVAG